MGSGVIAVSVYLIYVVIGASIGTYLVRHNNIQITSALSFPLFVLFWPILCILGLSKMFVEWLASFRSR
jgi:hypothetical protein